MERLEGNPWNSVAVLGQAAGRYFLTIIPAPANGGKDRNAGAIMASCRLASLMPMTTAQPRRYWMTSFAAVKHLRSLPLFVGFAGMTNV
jgi:hypothetical protein